MQTKLCGKLICFTQNRKALWRRRRQRRQRRQRRPNCCTIEHKAILINFMAHLFAWHLGALQLFVEYIPHCNFLLLENTIIIPGQVEFALLCTSRGGKTKGALRESFLFYGKEGGKPRVAKVDSAQGLYESESPYIYKYPTRLYFSPMIAEEVFFWPRN